MQTTTVDIMSIYQVTRGVEHKKIAFRQITRLELRYHPLKSEIHLLTAHVFIVYARKEEKNRRPKMEQEQGCLPTLVSAYQAEFCIAPYTSNRTAFITPSSTLSSTLVPSGVRRRWHCPRFQQRSGSPTSEGLIHPLYPVMSVTCNLSRKASRELEKKHSNVSTTI